MQGQARQEGLRVRATGLPAEKRHSPFRVPGHIVVSGLLVSGIASSVLWVATDILASLLYDGYSYTAQTISELSAIDAPSRPYVGPAILVYDLLLIAFAFGIWQASGGNRALRVVAGLTVVHALVDLVLGPFSSMHQREVLAAGGATRSDTLHLVVAGSYAITIFLMAGFGAVAFGKGFRLYSIATILTLLVFGILTAMEAPKVQDNESTPWIGVTERINAYAAMLWIAVLAVYLLRGSLPAPRGRW